MEEVWDRGRVWKRSRIRENFTRFFKTLYKEKQRDRTDNRIESDKEKCWMKCEKSM